MLNFISRFFGNTKSQKTFYLLTYLHTYLYLLCIFHHTDDLLWAGGAPVDDRIHGDGHAVTG